MARMTEDKTSLGSQGDWQRRLRGFTIADVAREAQVSLGTVSNVLNGTRAVGSDRRARVLAAIEALGFKPNAHAQGLRRTRNSLVGLCIPHVANTYFMRLVDVFEKLSVADGIETVHVYARREADHLLAKVEWLIKFQVGGLIMLPSIDNRPTLDAIAKSGTPAVIIDRPIEDERFDQVVTDAAGAMQDIVAGLALRGHRRLLYATGSKAFLVTKVRMKGLERALRDRTEVTATLIEVDNLERPQDLLVSALFTDPRPTAVVAGSSRISAMILRALRQLPIPRSDWPAVVSFDQPEWADLSDPPIAVVMPPIDAIAGPARQLLTRRMQDNQAIPEHHLLVAEIDLSRARSISMDRRSV
jgi:LacI family transcriptional regulator